MKAPYVIDLRKKKVEYLDNLTDVNGQISGQICGQAMERVGSVWESNSEYRGETQRMPPC